MSTPLPVVQLPGLHLDTLGHYFAALGILRLAARKWPAIKGCWRGGVFCLVGGPHDFTALETFLLDIGANNKWTPYIKAWDVQQKNDTEVKSSENCALWLATEADEHSARCFLAHISTAERLGFNPVFGTGGNAGKRLFSSGWDKARNAVIAVAPKTKKPKKSVASASDILSPQMPPRAKDDLPAFLLGRSCSLLSDYGAGSWFSAANKIYNNGTRKPFREGQVTPWAMLLACEAFPLLAGGVSRQIGAARKARSTFPFVTDAPAPRGEKEAGVSEGEFWAPVWERPMSLAETAALFQRGRAEVNGRGALTSAAFAAAVIQKGTDAGLAEFRRFSLLHTTSAQTFETRLTSVHPMAAGYDAPQAESVARILRFRDSLPRDEKKGKRWRYRGLQGPVDQALVRLSATGANEDAWALLDATFGALDCCDKNKAFRAEEPSLEPLPLEWLTKLLATEDNTQELIIALALASLRAAKDDKKTGKPPAALLAYRLGVEKQGRLWRVPKNRPLRCVWGPRPLADNLTAVISRRLAESAADAQPPFDCQFALPLADAVAFLNGETDDECIARWLDRFLLFDWSFVNAETRAVLGRLPRSAPTTLQTDTTATFSLLRPLFHAYTFSELAKETGNDIATSSLIPLCALLSREDVPSAVRTAFAIYRAKLVPLADFGMTAFNIDDPVRLLAALALPVFPPSIILYFDRWLQPSNTKGKTP